jgi:hypothetical protein
MNSQKPNTEVESTTSPTNCDIASQTLCILSREHVKMFQNIFVGISQLQCNTWALDARQFHLARKFGIIISLPSVSEEELEDQIKGDAMLKGIALCQAIYLSLHIIIRHLQGLPSSQLEIMAVAFVPCAFIIYVLNLFKPQNVKVPRYIQASPWPTPDEMVSLAVQGPQRLDIHPNQSPDYTMPVLNAHKFFDSRRPILTYAVGNLVAVTVLASIHYATWCLVFPTTTEQCLWRISCIATSVIPLMLKYIYSVNGVYVENVFSERWRNFYKKLPNIGLEIFVGK